MTLIYDVLRREGSIVSVAGKLLKTPLVPSLRKYRSQDRRVAHGCW